LSTAAEPKPDTNHHHHPHAVAEPHRGQAEGLAQSDTETDQITLI